VQTLKDVPGNRYLRVDEPVDMPPATKREAPANN